MSPRPPVQKKQKVQKQQVVLLSDDDDDEVLEDVYVPPCIKDKLRRADGTPRPVVSVGVTGKAMYYALHPMATLEEPIELQMRKKLRRCDAARPAAHACARFPSCNR